MSEFVKDCPRCGARKVTFDIMGDVVLGTIDQLTYVFETLCLCRACNRSTIFVMHGKVKSSSHSWATGALSQYSGSLFSDIEVVSHVSISSQITIAPPEHLPAAVEACFKEGAACLAIQCFNAAGAMFRLALDIATKAMLESYSGTIEPNRDQRTKLAYRLDFLFDENVISPTLRELADSVRHDGNDGAHDGTLTEAEAEDLVDFTRLLLERIYTEPTRVLLAKSRRDTRRGRV